MLMTKASESVVLVMTMCVCVAARSTPQMQLTHVSSMRNHESGTSSSAPMKRACTWNGNVTSRNMFCATDIAQIRHTLVFMLPIERRRMINELDRSARSLALGIMQLRGGMASDVDSKGQSNAIKGQIELHAGKRSVGVHGTKSIAERRAAKAHAAKANAAKARRRKTMARLRRQLANFELRDFPALYFPVSLFMGAMFVTSLLPPPEEEESITAPIVAPERVEDANKQPHKQPPSSVVDTAAAAMNLTSSRGALARLRSSLGITKCLLGECYARLVSWRQYALLVTVLLHLQIRMRAMDGMHQSTQTGNGAHPGANPEIEEGAEVDGDLDKQRPAHAGA